MADKYVDVERTESLGQVILQSMYGKLVAEYSFHKKDQVTTLASSTYITVEGERLEIHPLNVTSELAHIYDMRFICITCRKINL